jgi:hypothetical protein
MSLASFYDAFLGAVVESEPRRLADFLDDRAAVENAIVYRNTVFRGAADALGTAFPAVARLAGATYFESVAIAFVAAEPPRQRSLVGYGETFPLFLERAPGVDQAPYLPDAARLDQAWLRAHRAAGGAALDAGALSAVSPEQLPELRLRLHPSVQLTALEWSVHDAWKDNRGDIATPSEREVRHEPQYVMHWRLGHEVESQVLAAAEARFFDALRQGQTLGEAAERAIACASDFNISLIFADALEAGLFDTSQLDLEQKGE